jgi:hypothetical protein
MCLLIRVSDLKSIIRLLETGTASGFVIEESLPYSKRCVPWTFFSSRSTGFATNWVRLLEETFG